MDKSHIAIIGLIVVSFAVSIYFYPQMPEKVASHWNARGEVDGYMPKFWGIFLIPLISIFLFLLLWAIPKIDPLRMNIEKFRKHYDGFVLIFLGFMLYVQVLIISSNIGIEYNMTQMLSPAFGILFYYCGFLVENTKQNWFIGIRTPWTLSSEKVWNKTHKIGGKLFKASGVIALFGFILPSYALFLMAAPVILAAVYTVVYSYFEYRKEEKK
jgi:uncharacterized membrane protein